MSIIIDLGDDIVYVSLFGKLKDSVIEFTKLYLDMAKTISKKSKDRSSKVGCVIVSKKYNTVLSLGYNGFPRGFISDDDDKYHERPLKYDYTNHAEENAICSAARNGGVSLFNSVLFCTHPPCHKCTRLLINSGVETMIFPKKQDKDFIERSKDSFEIAKHMCEGLAHRIVLTENDEFEISPW
jgi:dCMP deaminase